MRILPELSKFLYMAVGSGLYWVDRLGWSREQWEESVAATNLEQWLLHAEGTLAGFFELVCDEQGCEIKYLGLLPQFRGVGLGGPALDAAITRGFEISPSVWLTTCSTDHPRALDNYLRRGFKVTKEETVLKDWPAISPTYW